MGKRGPKTQPTSLKILHGNPGKRRLNEDEPQPDSGIPEMQDGLTEEAQKAWQDFAQKLDACGVLTKLDGPALALLSAVYVAHWEAQQKVAKGGAVWIKKAEEGELPKFVYSPYWAVQNREFKKLMQLLAEFGMTPSSRSGIKVGKKNDGGIMTRKRTG